jgi:hypothetical protein
MVGEIYRAARYTSIENSIFLMLLREISVYSENSAKHFSVLGGQNAKYKMRQQTVD